jgi:transcriptional accessory protein Tex/SPT6
MDFPLPAKITNLLVSTRKPAQDPLSLKIGQLIEVKVLDVSLKKNIIALQLGKTTFEAQPQPSLSSLQNSPQTQVILKSGETLKVQVTKLTPEPEFKIEKASIPTEHVNPL